MKDYFALQFKRLYRILKEAGVNPWLGIVVAIALFVIGSIALYFRLPYPDFVYAGIAVGSTSTLAGKQRNQFLKQCFSVRTYRHLRLFENLIWLGPFLVVLLSQQAFLTAGIALLLGLASSRLELNLSAGFALPTPFSGKPFEFAIGFRKTFWIFLVSYALVSIAYYSGNYNIGVFALAVTLFTAFSYYIAPEPRLYVWTHHLTPAEFLRKKLRIGLLYALALSLPLAIALGLAFPKYAWLTLIFQLLGLLYVALGILGKYAYFPSEVNVMQLITLGLCLLFPPALLFVLPAFYSLSLQKLKPLLS